MAGKRKRPDSQQSLFERKAPVKMPEGHYSGDKPNPNLRAFVEQHIRERPYDPETDDYDVPAFDKPIDTKKTTAIYNMHTYWSKKPHDAIRQYICHYTEPGDLVLDPLCGSGGTALAALMEGRKAIAIDRSPAATFITKNYCTAVDVYQLHKAFKELNRKVKPEIDWLYETHCDRCGGKADIYATVYSATFRCIRCLSDIPLLHAESEKTGYNSVTYFCPRCSSRGVREKISLRTERRGDWPMTISYYCRSAGCPNSKEMVKRSFPFPRETNNYPDLVHIEAIKDRPIIGSVPDIAMMFQEEGKWGLLQRPYHGNIRLVKDFYSERNLRAVSVIIEAIKSSFSGNLKDTLLFAIEAISMNMSKLQGYSTNPRFPNNMMKGILYTPPIWREYNALNWLEGKIRNLTAGYKTIGEANIDPRQVMISTQSVCDLSNIPSNSIDYIFTDPPYSYKIQFGELNFMWEAWLELASDWKDEEIIVNAVRGKDDTNWADMMRLGIAEMYRVLRPGRTMSLCYHDSSEGSWSLLQDLLAESGFVSAYSGETLYIDTDRKSWKQLVADKVTKRDLIINFRKPKPDEVMDAIAISGKEDKTTFNEKVCQIIRDYIGANSGSTKDHIYDEVVSRMVRRGQMEAHDFDELLRTVAEEVKTPVKKDLFRNEEPNIFGTHEIGRWYLKETELVIADAAENAREDAAAEKIGAFIKGHLKNHPGDEGVHYSDLFEHYIYAVKDKPRRQLAEFLPDYFYKTEQGTWRLPASEEEELAKREARVKGLGRRVKRYIAQLEQGAIIAEHERPNDATLADWIRHCKRAGLYEQGKLLYEKGGLNPDNLPEDVMVNAEEDYQVCARMLARGKDSEAGKTRKRRKE